MGNARNQISETRIQKHLESGFWTLDFAHGLHLLLRQCTSTLYDVLPMLPHARHRRGQYPLARTTAVPEAFRWILGAFIAIVILLYLGTKVLQFFGVGNAIRRMPVALATDGRGTINVTLDGSELQRAQDGMKLYSGDQLTTGKGSRAALHFFDDTVLRIDEGGDLTINEAALGEKSSVIDLSLDQGTLWLSVPAAKAFTGTILRTIQTPFLGFSIPPGTEGIFGAMSAIVYSADGPGVTVTFRTLDADPVIIGEGQRFELPEDIAHISDPYSYRSPLDPLSSRPAFVEESRRERQRLLHMVRATGTPPLPSEAKGVLTVREPEENAVLTTSTVTVAGSIGLEVETVRVNEYQAVIDSEARKFSQELALPIGEGEFEIRIAALDDEGATLEETHRTVRRQVKAPDAPTISAPANTGETWRTQRQEFVIRGNAPTNAAGIVVNDYRLQLFTPGAREWQYLASTKLGNLHAGENRFAVYALDAAGNRSPISLLTVLIEEGSEGVVGAGAPSAASVSERPEDLPNNAPLKPGSLAVTGPTPGTEHTATGSEFLIEGTTDPGTASIWVNDYRLQLYTAGKITWNYIASAGLHTLKPGRNVYRIVARNGKGEILDSLEYRVTYRP